METIDVATLLGSLPELNNDNKGMYNITSLQVASAFTKTGVTPLIQSLLVCEDVKQINQGDQLGRTPLHYAVMNGNVELVELLLNSGSDTECKFLYHESTLRTSHADYNKWNKLYSMLPPPDGWGRTPLHRAAKEGHVDIVRCLIKNKANVNAKDEKGITPLLLAGGNQQNKKSFEAIVEMLVKSGAEVNIRNNVTVIVLCADNWDLGYGLFCRDNVSSGTTPLFHAVALKNAKVAEILLKAGAWLTEDHCNQTQLHEIAANGQFEILEMILEDPRLTVQDINKPDGCGRTPVYRAAYGGNRECLKILISKGGSLAYACQTKETVMDAIFARITRPAQFLKDLLDSKISGNYIKPTHENYKITLDFSILAPHGNDYQMDVISNILVAAGEKEKIEILQHPLVETFLRLKWTKIRQFFFLLIFSYTAFVLSLSAYVVLLVHNPGRYEIITEVARCFVILSAGGLLGHAIIQLILIRRNFLQQYEVFMNLTCTIASLSVAIYNFKTKIAVTDIDVEIPTWILHATSIAVLLAWAELMLLIGRFPTYGYYALMFAAVLRNVSKVLITFVCLVIGFALSFSIQFRNTEEFTDPWRALVKTTVMMMGEFEYVALFGNSGDSPVRLHTTSRVIFLLFIILASIVLMNLMVGLAVSDIQGLQQEGHALRLEKQAEFLRQLETVISFKAIDGKWFPAFIRGFLKRKRCIALTLTIQPEHAGSITVEAKRTKRLPSELIDSIVTIATNHQDSNIDSLRNARLPDLLDALKVVLYRYERRMTTA